MSIDESAGTDPISQGVFLLILALIAVALVGLAVDSWFASHRKQARLDRETYGKYGARNQHRWRR